MLIIWTRNQARLEKSSSFFSTIKWSIYKVEIDIVDLYDSCHLKTNLPPHVEVQLISWYVNVINTFVIVTIEISTMLKYIYLRFIQLFHSKVFIVVIKVPSRLNFILVLMLRNKFLSYNERIIQRILPNTLKLRKKSNIIGKKYIRMHLEIKLLCPDFMLTCTDIFLSIQRCTSYLSSIRHNIGTARLETWGSCNFENKF